MKTVGIIGGIGSESTIEYYRLIISAYRQRKQNGDYPQIIINSINMTKMLAFIEAGQLSAVTSYLVDEVRKLAEAGVDFGLLASNTPHLVFDRIRELSPIPLISIVEATCQEAKALGLSKVGLFGTRFTMQSGFYQAVFAQEDISVVVPAAGQQNYIHQKYMGELVNGIILAETKSQLLEIVDVLKKEAGIQGLILGGTELPLILKETDASDIPFLDTTRIHVDRIVTELLSSATV